jgi:NAD(P)H-hydrate epimerase
MREWEKASWAACRKPGDVIDQVGRAIARRMESLVRPGEKILFLAGKGNNGADARAARKHLSRLQGGIIVEAADPARGLQKFLASLDGCAWIVDGLFGIGLDRPLDARWQKLIKAVNNSNRRMLAVDVPSGLNAQTGGVEGAAIRADLTLTVGAPKPGLLKAAQYVGRLEVLPDIGLTPCPFAGELNWTVNTDFAHLPPRRPVESNKGTYGHLAIFAGSLGYHGAVVLAGQGAMRARPGLISIYPQPSVYAPVAAQSQAIMVHPWQARQSPPKNCSAILFGPGLAAANLPAPVKNTMRTHWRNTLLPMVVDASALDWLQAGPTPPRVVRLITPHPGEAGRMLGTSATEVQADRVSALRQLSKRFGNCYVVLKGHQTLVGRARGPIFINSSGNPALAQGGSGDLLGGFVAGLLAQPHWQKDPMTTIRYAVWEHGAAADRLSQDMPNWTVMDLAGKLGF